MLLGKGFVAWRQPLLSRIGQLELGTPSSRFLVSVAGKNGIGIGSNAVPLATKGALSAAQPSTLRGVEAAQVLEFGNMKRATLSLLPPGTRQLTSRAGADKLSSPFRHAVFDKRDDECGEPGSVASRWLLTPHPSQLPSARLLSSGRGESEQSKLQRLAGGVGAAGLLLWGKTKWVLAGLKFTKFMPALSMLASTGAYAFFYGWPFAVGMVGQIFLHESGHWLVMKYYGIPTGPMTFIPFMGAVVEMRGRPEDVAEEAIVAFGGPVAGGAAALALSATGVATGSNMLIALADFGFMINLFNLLPLGSLDGGRIAGAVSPYFLVAGLAGGVALAVQGVIGNPLFYLILLSGGFTVYDRFFGGGVHGSYYRTSSQAKFAISAFYIALIAALLAAMAWNAQHKKSLRTLRRENPNMRMGEAGGQLERFANDWMDEDEKIRQMELDHERRFFGN